MIWSAQKQSINHDSYLSGMDGPIRFQSFVYYPDRGELIRREEHHEEVTSRLAPQPNKLLLLLLERSPEILTHEEIKEAIWPEVQVEFEKSLHYCIRQIRSVLDDSAGDPQFIETIPRRGYRWIADWEPASATAAASERRPAFTRYLLFALFALALFLFFFARSSLRNTAGSAPIRLAVMSFQPLVDSSSFVGNDIALQLVATLTNNYPQTLEVIGPTTTDRYPPDRLADLIQDLDIDIILNGRFSRTDPQDRMLAEVIRAEDGAHVWVKYFGKEVDHQHITQTILDGLREKYPNLQP
jgi:DNA-binding winged helix-turn-helix (wHTH) protein/TolB-like protein